MAPPLDASALASDRSCATSERTWSAGRDVPIRCSHHLQSIPLFSGPRADTGHHERRHHVHWKRSAPAPARPSLEYERKEAKAPLRRLRAGHPESLARAGERHPAIPHPAEPLKLSDAQLVVAREYGFASWPRLVRYFKGLERRRAGEYSLHPREIHESRVRSLIAEHAQRHTLGARAFAAFVPRFYGLRRDQVLAMPVTEDDARLAVARMNGLPSWQVLMEEVEEEARTRRERDWGTHPMEAARDAIRRADLATLQQVVAAHAAASHPEERDVVPAVTPCSARPSISHGSVATTRSTPYSAGCRLRDRACSVSRTSPCSDITACRPNGSASCWIAGRIRTGWRRTVSPCWSTRSFAGGTARRPTSSPGAQRRAVRSGSPQVLAIWKGWRDSSIATGNRFPRRERIAPISPQCPR